VWRSWRRGTNEVVEERNSSAKDHRTQDPLSNTVGTAYQPRIITLSPQENEDSRCKTCEALIGSSCHSIEIPYGYLLDGEEPCEGQPLVSIKDRATALQESDPVLFSRLNQLGTAGVPSDGRLPLINFWSPIRSDDLKVALGTMRKIIHDKYVIFDFNSHEVYVKYGLGELIIGTTHMISDDL
jgi:hypothetical protein